MGMELKHNHQNVSPFACVLCAYLEKVLGAARRCLTQSADNVAYNLPSFYQHVLYQAIYPQPPDPVEELLEALKTFDKWDLEHDRGVISSELAEDISVKAQRVREAREKGGGDG